MMIEHEINKLDNFICGWYNDDTSICDRLIQYHSINPKLPGALNQGSTMIKSVKDSIDCKIQHKDIETEYKLWMGKSMSLYVEKYPYSNNYAPWMPVEPINIQYYKPGAAFFAWHTERTGVAMPIAGRHLVFMTYLNDVTEGGETEWFHQKIKVKPERGLTIIWPADWTFTHRGCVSMTQEKYIVTGWSNYIPYN